MKKLFSAADEYISKSDWKTIAALKFCLLAMGTIIGMSLPEKQRKPVLTVCVPVFAVTYVPLMWKFIRIALSQNSK